MAVTSTYYDVILRYRLRDQTFRGLRAIEAQAKSTAAAAARLGRRSRRSAQSMQSIDEQATRAAGSTSTLAATLRRAGAAAVGFFGLRAAKSALIDFTSSMEQARLQTAGLLQLHLGGTFNQQLGVANKLVDQLQERAKASTATTAEMVSFMSEIVGPASQAGLATKDLAEFTASAVVAAKAFGREQTASLDIQQAILKGVEIRDFFTTQLLAGIKMERAEFNKLNQAERLAALQRAVRAPAISDLARAQAKSFAGVVSTFKDQLQLTFEKVGIPLTKAITAEVTKWNAWFEKNPERIKAFARDFGNALKDAFTVLRDIGAFLVRHRDLLLAIAKAVIITKGARWGAEQLLNIGLFNRGLQESAGGLKGFGGSLSGAAASLNKLVPALAAVYAGADLAAKRIDKAQDVELKNNQERSTIWRTAKEIEKERTSGLKKQVYYGQRALLREARTAGIVSAKGVETGRLREFIDPAKIRAKRAAEMAPWILRANLMAGAEAVIAAETQQLQRELRLAIVSQYEQVSGKQIPRIFDKPIVAAEEYAMMLKYISLSEFAASQSRIASAAKQEEAAAKQNQAASWMVHAVASLPEMVSGARIFEKIPEVTAKIFKKAPSFNVTINKVEVQSEDPDLFVFGLISAVEDTIKNRTAAFDEPMEG